jgi:hypothetical protein
MKKMMTYREKEEKQVIINVWVVVWDQFKENSGNQKIINQV